MSDIATPLCFGALGASKHFQKKVLRSFEECSDSKLVSIASKSASASYFPGYTFYSTYEELLEDDSIEAVYISLPNHLHCEWTCRALEAGKHVLCEKPIALSLEEADKMHSLAQEVGLVVAEAFMWRFHPVHHEVKRILSSGKIGSLRVFQSSFQYYLDTDDNIRMVKNFGGGALYDVGCYLLNSSRFFFDSEPTMVSATADIDPKTGVDTRTSIQLTFPCNGSAQLTCGCRLPPRKNYYTLQGDKGCITVQDAYARPRGKPARIEIETEDGRKTVQVEPANHFSIMLDAFSKTCRNISKAGFENIRLNTRAVEQTFSALS